MIPNPPRTGQEIRTPDALEDGAPRSDLDILLRIYARVADARQSVVDALADSVDLRPELHDRGPHDPGLPAVLQNLAHRIEVTGKILQPLIAAERERAQGWREG